MINGPFFIAMFEYRRVTHSFFFLKFPKKWSATPRILIGNLQGAFQIAQRLGSMQDVLHINSRAQAVGDQELLKSIATFMAYNPVGKKR